MVLQDRMWTEDDTRLALERLLLGRKRSVLARVQRWGDLTTALHFDQRSVQTVKQVWPSLEVLAGDPSTVLLRGLGTGAGRPTVVARPNEPLRSVTIYFGVGSTELNERDRQNLDVLIGSLSKLLSPYIQVEGHADDTGGSMPNQFYSERRALAVAEYLKGRCNVPSSHFYIIASGADRPVAPNDTAEGRAKNRRTVISVFGRPLH